MIREKVQELLRDVANTMSDYKQVVDKFTYHQAFSQKQNLEILDKRVNSLFDRSAELIKPQVIIDRQSEMAAEERIPELIALNEELDRLRDEINKRTRSFNATINHNTKSFDIQNNAMSDLYAERKSDEEERHAKAELKIKTEINYIAATFDTKIKSEVGQVIDANQIKKVACDDLQNSFNKMKGKLESQLNEINSKAEIIDSQIKLSETSNTDDIKQLEDSYKKLIETKESDFFVQKNLLDQKNQILKAEIEDAKNKHEESARDMRSRLKSLTEKNSQQMQSRINEYETELTKALNDKTIEFTNEENQQILNYEKQKKENADDVAKLTSELNKLNGVLAQQESSTAVRIRDATKESENKILEKETELKQQSSENKKIVDQTKQRMSKDLLNEQRKQAQQLSSLEKKLIDVANTAENQKKQLESEVTSLIRQKVRMEQEFAQATEKKTLKKEKSKSARREFQLELKPDESVVSVEPVAKSKDDIRTIEEMNSAFDSAESNAVRNIAKLKAIKKKGAEQLKKTKMQVEEKIEENENQKRILKDEIKDLKERLVQVEARVKAAENNHKVQQQLAEASLRSKISMQKDVIQKLKEDIQIARADDSKHQQISIIQSKYRNAIAQLGVESENEQDRADREYEETSEEMVEDLRVVRDKADADVEQIRSKLIAKLSELVKIRKEVSTEAENDAQKWMELRKDIADKSTRIAFQAASSKVPRTPMSKGGVKTPVSRQAPLPPLKNV